MFAAIKQLRKSLLEFSHPLKPITSFYQPNIEGWRGKREILKIFLNSKKCFGTLDKVLCWWLKIVFDKFVWNSKTNHGSESEFKRW